MTGASGGDISEPRQSQSSFTFGDSHELCDQLLALVRSSKKTATCGALRDDHNEGEKLPIVGRRDVALAEGGGDCEEWKAKHIAFFERNGGFDPKMELVRERFKLVEVFA